MSKQYEVRTIDAENTELRSVDDDEQQYCEGFGVVYDREVEIYPGYYEKINANAFKRCLDKNTEIKSFINHNCEQILSTTKSNPSLQIESREKGLWFKSPIPPTQYGKDLAENLRRGNIKGASFMFSVPDGGDMITRDKKGKVHREIVDCDIYEIGPVTSPAYNSTRVNLRSIESVVEELNELAEEEKESISETINDNVVVTIDTSLVDNVMNINKSKLRNKKIKLYNL